MNVAEQAKLMMERLKGQPLNVENLARALQEARAARGLPPEEPGKAREIAKDMLDNPILIEFLRTLGGLAR